MKTAVEKIIEEIDNEVDFLKTHHYIAEVRGRMIGLAFAKRVALELKELEKEHLVKAVDAVQIVHRKYFENGWTGEDILGKEVPTTKDRTYFGLSKNGEQYYNQTFKQ